MDLIFDFRGQIVTFTVEVTAVKDDLITAVSPEFLYKNLDRSFSRIQTPADLQVRMNFLGDRYSLSYPRVSSYESAEINPAVQNLDLKNLGSVIGQIALWAKGFASGHKLVIFKDVKPTTTEERVVAETGKSLYLASTLGGFPTSDPYPKRRLVTEEMFKRYLESTGVDLAFVDEAGARFIRSKYDNGIFSDLWVPVLFQEYVIGYIHVWTDKDGQNSLDLTVIDRLYQFAAVLAQSLKVNGYFESGKLKNDAFEGKVIDISASGLLFVHPQMASSLLPDCELAIQLVTPKRMVSTNARIVRRYKDMNQWFFGVRFLDMAPEDIRFLFEFIYGKTFTESDAEFLAGQV
jgi:hypothetical protein